jgi:MerR family transcriptional regulator, light-induced transcriptional regulator
MADLRQSAMPEAVQQQSHEGAASGFSEAVQTHDNLLEFPPSVRDYDGPAAIAILQATVEREILPRIALAHPVRARRELAKLPALRAPVPGRVSNEVREFCKLVLSKNPEAATLHVGWLRARGYPLDSIYLELLAPSARYLRHLWDQDVCDFAEATLALWRLQQILREFSTAFRSSGAQHSCGLRALLAPGPGETHELGYLMFEIALVGEFFRRDGWDAWIEPKSSGVEFASLVRSQWFDVVEFLVSGDKRLDALAASISAVRRDSPNQGLRVLVCGPVFVQHPELVLVVGGDVPAADPRLGVAQARNLVGLSASRG